MRLTVLTLALASASILAAGNAAVAPQRAANRQSTIGNLKSPESVTIPQMLSYQGKLTDTLGQPVPDGSYSLRFRLYTEPSGGGPFWTETQSISVRGGLFHAMLGAESPIYFLPDSGGLYLSLQVESEPELSPRLRIVSAAYAYVTERAANSDRLQGKDTTGFVQTGQTGSVTSAMIVDGTVGAADLGQMEADSGQVMKWNGAAWVATNDSVGTADNAWTRSGSDSVLYTIHELGLARGGADNKLWGESAYTHVNLGVACTTGVADQAYRYATVAGGQANIASKSWSTVCGGFDNVADGDHATLGGGEGNNAGGQYAFLGGGYWNGTSANYATVGGGIYNGAGDVYSVVAGGYSNHANGTFSTVGGGNNNYATDTLASVGGGNQNAANGVYSVVAGGSDNVASGRYSAVAGGSFNAGRGYCSYAGGHYARANHNGSFAWSDSSVAESESLYTTGNNQFRVRARGGTWFFSNAGMTTGAYLAPNSNSWESACDSTTKEDFRAVDKQALLDRVAGLRVRNYKMKDQNDGTRHIGPVAQDFRSAFGYGETETGINLADADGVALAAIQALYEDNRQLRQEVEALKARLAGQ